jgi:hypothetical protein
MWQVAAYLAGRRLDGDVRFDVVHHVTFVNYWLPTFLPFLAKPFIWGSRRRWGIGAAPVPANVEPWRAMV